MRPTWRPTKYLPASTDRSNQQRASSNLEPNHMYMLYGCTAVPCLPRAQCQCNGSRTCHMTNEWALGSDTSVAVWAQTAERRNKKTCTPPPAANQRLPSSEQSESPSDGTKCCQLAAVHPKHVCKHLPRPPVSKWRAHLRHHPLPFARVAVPTKLAACGSDHLLPLCTTSAR